MSLEIYDRLLTGRKFLKLDESDPQFLIKVLLLPLSILHQIQSMTGVVSRSSYMLFKVHGFQNIQKIASDCITSYVNVKIKIANDQDWFRG